MSELTNIFVWPHGTLSTVALTANVERGSAPQSPGHIGLQCLAIDEATGMAYTVKVSYREG